MADAILYGKTLLKRYMFYRKKGVSCQMTHKKSPVNGVFTGVLYVPKAGLEFGEACLFGDGTYLRALFFNGFVI